MEMDNIESQKYAILIVDNHCSRLNSYAIEYLLMHKIHLLTLPSHCTHVMQPIDVSVASSFKANLNRFKISVQSVPQLQLYQTQAAKNRYSILYSIQKAWEMISEDIIKAGFEKTGIYPFNPSRAITNKYTHASEEIYQSQNQNFNMSNKLLTSDTNRLLIANKYYNSNFTQITEIPKPLYYLVKSYFTQGNLNNGFILNKLPSLFIRIRNDTFVKIIS